MTSEITVPPPVEFFEMDEPYSDAEVQWLIAGEAAPKPTRAQVQELLDKIGDLAKTNELDDIDNDFFAAWGSWIQTEPDFWSVGKYEDSDTWDDGGGYVIQEASVSILDDVILSTRTTFNCNYDEPYNPQWNCNESESETLDPDGRGGPAADWQEALASGLGFDADYAFDDGPADPGYLDNLKDIDDDGRFQLRIWKREDFKWREDNEANKFYGSEYGLRYKTEDALDNAETELGEWFQPYYSDWGYEGVQYKAKDGIEDPDEDNSDHWEEIE